MDELGEHLRGEGKHGLGDGELLVEPRSRGGVSGGLPQLNLNEKGGVNPVHRDPRAHRANLRDLTRVG